MRTGVKVAVIATICAMAIAAFAVGAVILPKLTANTSSSKSGAQTTTSNTPTNNGAPSGSTNGATQKIEVEDLNLSYDPRAAADFTVTNLYDSQLTTIGLTVNGVNCGLSTPNLPAGQAQDESLPLQNVALSSLTTYNVKLTFTWADNTYQDYSGSYATPIFKGQAQVTAASLTYVTDSGEYFSFTLKNTGNLPITSVNYTLALPVYPYQLSVPAFLPTIMPGQSETYNSEPIMCQFQAGAAYPLTIQITCADGSTSTIQTSVIAQ
jgi:hypothetical protein